MKNPVERFQDQQLFEKAMAEVLGDKMRADPDFCIKVWSALANVTWFEKGKEDTQDIGLSFRVAGSFIASIIGKGDYLDWYCSGPTNQVDQEIADLMSAKGYDFRLYGNKGKNYV